jgi:hypothetical protein
MYMYMIIKELKNLYFFFYKGVMLYFSSRSKRSRYSSFYFSFCLCNNFVAIVIQIKGEKFE